MLQFKKSQKFATKNFKKLSMHIRFWLQTYSINQENCLYKSVMKKTLYQIKKRVQIF